MDVVRAPVEAQAKEPRIPPFGRRFPNGSHFTIRIIIVLDISRGMC